MVCVASILNDHGISVEASCYRSSSREMLDFKIVSGNFYDVTTQQDGAALRYKQTVDVVDFPQLCRMLPQLQSIQFSTRDRFPYFVAGLSEIAEKIAQGEPVAVEGGPCLFGTDEVRVIAALEDGRSFRFDYNTGKNYQVRDDEVGEFRAFVQTHGAQIRAIHFENRKIGLTPQEWAFIKYPFEIARALSAPLVIPIPDLSYVKYLDAVLAQARQEVRVQTLAEFRQVSHHICDLYLDLIQRVRALYPDVPCTVVHERDQVLCQQYYAARSPFMEKRKTTRTLTGIPEKLESIKDYVSMPALPLYLYGISNVIEVDSMDETDSFRKCRKAHKGDLNLGCILFPELLAEDGAHTIFDAPWERKEYGAFAVE